MGFLDEHHPWGGVDRKQLFGEFGYQVARGGLVHAECRNDARDTFLHNCAGDLASHVAVDLDVSVPDAEHDDGQSLVLSVGGEAQAPPHVDRVKDYEGNTVLEKLLGHHPAEIGLARTPLC